MGLGSLPVGEPGSQAWGISANGGVIVGSGRSSYQPEAFRWTISGGMVGLGFLPGAFDSRAYAASADGSAIVGKSGSEAFLWTSGGGMVGLGTPSEAFGISADGSVIVGGVSDNSSYRGNQAFRWTSDAGMVGLGDLYNVPGIWDSIAFGVSADGGAVVGSSGGSLFSYVQAFLWTSDGGMVGLGYLPGGQHQSNASAVSAGGSVVVGSSLTAASGDPEAFVWTESQGMLRLLDVLVANGATGLMGFTLVNANAISADGQWVAGYGINPNGGGEAFLANISPVPVPPAVWLFGSALGALGWLRRKTAS